jgi:hypothetical protein
MKVSFLKLLNEQKPGLYSWHRYFLRAGRPGVRITIGAKDFPSSKIVQIISGINPASYSVSTVFFFAWGKSPDRELYHASSTSFEEKNEMSYKSKAPIRLHVVYVDNLPLPSER